MLGKAGMTLMEIIVVLILVAIATVFTLPNFTVPTERAKAQTAQNNLLAIYSAQQNYLNNNNNANYCNTTINANYCDTLSDINTDLSLNIQDDGTYLYQCTTAVQCTATRTNSSANLVLRLTLNAKVLLGTNPQCTSTSGNSNWCP